MFGLIAKIRVFLALFIPSPGFFAHCRYVCLIENLIFVYSATGTPAAVPKLSNAQISEHYSTCIKLSTENVSGHKEYHKACRCLFHVDNVEVPFCVWQKITTKNAFGLHLIDYMADILRQKDSELTNFKV